MRSLSHPSGAPRRNRRPARARLAVESLEGRIVPRASLFQVTKLVSDQAGMAQLTDSNLVNAWGLAFSSTSPFWVANNGTNTSTLYSGDHVGPPAVPLSINSLVVNLPGGAPTGAVFNSTTSDFVITDGTNMGKAAFLFVTEGGEIVGWNANVPPGPPTSTQGQIAQTVQGAIFKGVTIAQSGGNNYLYATDFHNGVIDVFDGMFHPVTLAGNFTDPNLPAGYAPFNIFSDPAFSGKLFVTYAKQDANAEDELHGVSLGFVDVFNTDGTFDKRLVQHGLLDAPWGMAIAPSNFGSFGGALLVGNFGNGEINAYNPTSGHFLGTLRDAHGQKIKIDGLWALKFGNGAGAGDTNALYFTAGPDDESHGLFGSIRVTQANPHTAVEAVGADAGGGPHVKVFDEATGRQRFSFFAYSGAFHGGVRVAVGDVNDDGTPDIVTAPGRGGGPDIRVFDGTDGHLIREFMAFDQNFRGGVNVAVSDVNGDDFDDIIVGADAGGGPHVKVFSGADGSVLQSFMAFDLAFTGGVRVAAGDVDFDGLADVITAAGIGGGPQVKAFDAFDHSLVENFLAFSSALRGGIFVAAGDVDGDGTADIVIGGGVGMGPQVAVFDPVTNTIRQSFAAYAANFSGGVRVAVRDADDDGHADIITGAGSGGGPHVRVFNGNSLGDMHDLMAFDGNFRGGVFVG